MDDKSGDVTLHCVHMMINARVTVSNWGCSELLSNCSVHYNISTMTIKALTRRTMC